MAESVNESDHGPYDQDQGAAAARRVVDQAEGDKQPTPETDIGYVLVETMNEAAYTRLHKFETLEEAQAFADSENSDPNGDVATVIPHPTGLEAEYNG